jgi:F0F1-type ATP synthase delta subunit
MNREELILQLARIRGLGTGLVRELELIELSKKAKVDELIELAEKFEEGEIKVVSVFCPKELSTTDKKRIAKEIQDKWEGELVFEWKIDKEMGGGWRAELGDLVIDHSLEGWLLDEN